MIGDAPVGVSVLGATGSIGTSTLDVLARHPDQYRVVALSADRNDTELMTLCARFEPEVAALTDPIAAQRLAQEVKRRGLSTSVLSGDDGQRVVASHASATTVMSAITGAAGLAPTLAAVRAGKRVLLANKEALVMTGRLLLEEVSRSGARLLPIDSEHNAVFQCLPQDGLGARTDGVDGIVLTASGGPFRTWSSSEIVAATPEQALAHPRWQMGKKISIDSASLMNKGLEVIEASFLFGLSVDKVDVVVHPQSTIHSLVRYCDGSLLAQLGVADMRIPIAHALAWPQRIESGAENLDLVALSHLDFEAPDTERFPALRLAREAARVGGTATAILNAANEVAVRAFLDRRIGFRTLTDVVDQTLDRVASQPADSLETVLDADTAARMAAAEAVKQSPLVIHDC